MTVRYEVITPNELDTSLINAWKSIQARNPTFSSPYFCPEFTQAVGSVRPSVRVALIINDGRPIGFFPYQRSFLGSGMPVGGPLSDFHGIIVDLQGDWDLCDLLRAAKLSVWRFDHLITNSGMFAKYVSARAASPQVDLRSGYAHYTEGRRHAGSDYIPKTEGLARKFTREVGALNFTLHAEDEVAMRQVLIWKSHQYRESRLPDAFGVSWTRELLTQILHTQSAGFAGVLSVLRAEGKIVAAHIGMRSRDVMHYWFPAYDPSFAKYSTGIILFLRMAEALAAVGVRTIDLGKGESQYKQRLMTGAVHVDEGAIELPSVLANMRRVQRLAEASARRGGIAATMRIPLKAIRRIESILRFR
jgi:CelD/BcsL family acetyltransferase involved in cellulose biosynthesis